MKEVSVNRRRERKGVERKRGRMGWERNKKKKEERERKQENKGVCVFCSLFVFSIRAQSSMGSTRLNGASMSTAERIMKEYARYKSK